MKNLQGVDYCFQCGTMIGKGMDFCIQCENSLEEFQSEKDWNLQMDEDLWKVIKE